MRIFFKKDPPKTTLDNLNWIPHLEQLLIWFVKNDKHISQIISESIQTLFKDGYRPESDEHNNPKLLEEQSNGEFKINNPIGWVSARLWLDLIYILQQSTKDRSNLEEQFKTRLDYIEQGTEKTVIAAGNIGIKYEFDFNKFNLEKELSKVKSDQEKEIFKKSFLDDTLVSAEVRLLAWIYQDLFNKQYRINTSKLSR